MSNAMNRTKLATSLLTLLASGGTLERMITHLPRFKSQIEAAFEWMRSNAKCSAAEVGHLADRFGEAIRTKDAALKRKDFRVASDARIEELALLRSLGLSESTGTWRKVMEVEVDEQIRDLSSLLSEMQSEPGWIDSRTSA
jgi:hypothetical protein